MSMAKECGTVGRYSVVDLPRGALIVAVVDS